MDEIVLKVIREGYQCHTECMFMRSEFGDDSAFCFFFKELLRKNWHKTDYDYDIYDTCEKCDRLSENYKEK